MFIHGASFPIMLAFGFEFAPGDSWMSYMADRGYLACGLDFLGFGESSRPPAMNAVPHGAPPVDRAPEAARQIALAVDYMRRQRGTARLHLVAHSWGTIPAAAYVAGSPSMVASLTLFGPVVPKPEEHPDKVDFAWWNLSAQARYEQLEFTDVLPPTMHLLEPAVRARWAGQFDASAPPSSKAPNGELRIPAGPLADIVAAEAGSYPYAQDKVTCPIFVVSGDYDTVVDRAGAAAFLARFVASPLKWLVQIDHGTHVMHLEKNRHSLYSSVQAFVTAVEDRTP
ncbi:alpha/beta hydrolase fold protein [Rhodanobacter thiooxydans LCS2]|nr:alpha/beta hydrolase fold protein [Rhodanobacter thiooxydans LCS2]